MDERSTLDVLMDGRSRTAQVTRKLPVLNTSTRTQTVILTLATADGVVPGQTGELLLEERIEQRGYWVPNTALQEGIQGLWTCYVATPGNTSEDDHTIEPRDVEVLHVEENRSYVRGTLTPGQRVVTSSLHKLVAKQPVRVAE